MADGIALMNEDRFALERRLARTAIEAVGDTGIAPTAVVAGLSDEVAAREFSDLSTWRFWRKRDRLAARARHLLHLRSLGLWDGGA